MKASKPRESATLRQTAEGAGMKAESGTLFTRNRAMSIPPAAYDYDQRFPRVDLADSAIRNIVS